MIPLCKTSIHISEGTGTPKENLAICGMTAPVKTSCIGLCLLALQKPLKFIRFMSPKFQELDGNVNCAAPAFYIFYCHLENPVLPNNQQFLRLYTINSYSIFFKSRGRGEGEEVSQAQLWRLL